MFNIVKTSFIEVRKCGSFNCLNRLEGFSANWEIYGRNAEYWDVHLSPVRKGFNFLSWKFGNYHKIAQKFIWICLNSL